MYAHTQTRRHIFMGNKNNVKNLKINYRILEAEISVMST